MLPLLSADPDFYRYRSIPDCFFCAHSGRYALCDNSPRCMNVWMLLHARAGCYVGTAAAASRAWQALPAQPRAHMHTPCAHSPRPCSAPHPNGQLVGSRSLAGIAALWPCASTAGSGISSSGSASAASAYHGGGGGEGGGGGGDGGGGGGGEGGGGSGGGGGGGGGGEGGDGGGGNSPRGPRWDGRPLTRWALPHRMEGGGAEETVSSRGCSAREQS